MTEIGLGREAVETLGMILTWVFCFYSAALCVQGSVVRPEAGYRDKQP